MKAKKISLITILTVIALVCATLCTFMISGNKKASASTSITENVRPYTGVDMSNGANAFQLDTPFTGSIKTIEAMVKPGAKTSLNGLGRHGVIMGGIYTSENGDNYFNIELLIHSWQDQSGTTITEIAPRLYWKAGGNVSAIDWQVDYAISAYCWYHITFARDTVADKMYCYINGEKVAERDGAGEEIPTPTAKHWVGRDGRDGVTTGAGSSYFMGQINYVAVSSTNFTDAQIKKSFYEDKRVITAEDNGALYYKDLSQKAATYFRAKDRLTSTPNTFTATINLPTSAKWYSGVIMGTFADDNGASGSRDTFNIEVTTGGYVRVIWDPGTFEKINSTYMNSNNVITNPDHTVDLIFNTPVTGYTGALNVNTGVDTHIAIVRDRSNGCFHLYINGVLASTKAPTTQGAINALKTNFIPLYAPAFGKDLRLALLYRQPSFLGQIKDCSIYSKAFTAQEIATENSAKDKTTLTKTESNGLMGNWVFDATQQPLKYDESVNKTLKDYSGNNNDAYLCTLADYYVPENNWFNVTDDEYTLIYIPDTQCTVRSQSSYTDIMFDWIVNNATDMNLSFVMGLGDIIDGVPLPGDETIAYEINTEKQWDIMIDNYNKLTEAGIYWNAIVGNHDYDENYLYPENGRKADIFNEHFGRDAVQQAKVVSYFNPNKISVTIDSQNVEVSDMLNVIYEYTAKTANGTEVKYLVVALEFGPSDDTLAWASEVISRPEYANHRVLINSHSLMFGNAEFNNAYTLGNPESYAWAWNNEINLNNGSQMWDEFMSKHDNVFLTTAGHIGTDTNITRTDKGIYGNTVLSTLCDGQSTKYFCDIDGIPGWGDPLILIAKVNEKTQQIKYYYFNPVNGMLFGVENQWTYDFSDALTSKQIYYDNGVELEKDYAVCGNNVTFTLTEKENKILIPTVKDILGNPVNLTNTNGTYSFVMADTRVTISVQEIDISTITLPAEITLEEGDVKDLTEYFPQGQFTLTAQSTNVSVNGYTITAVTAGEVTIVVTAQNFGEVATCKIFVTEKQNSNEGVEGTPPEVAPETPNSSSTANSNVSSNSQNANEGVEGTPPEVAPESPSSSGGCGSSISGTSVLIVFVTTIFAVILCIKKTKNQ